MIRSGSVTMEVRFTAMANSACYSSNSVSELLSSDRSRVCTMKGGQVFMSRLVPMEFKWIPSTAVEPTWKGVLKQCTLFRHVRIDRNDACQWETPRREL